MLNPLLLNPLLLNGCLVVADGITAKILNER